MRRGTVPIRRAQIVTGTGPGSIAISPDGFPMLVSCLDEWYQGEDTELDLTEFSIVDSRLQRALGVKEFRMPPDFRIRGSKNKKIVIPSSCFPRWCFCNRCFTLKCFSPEDQDARRFLSDAAAKRAGLTECAMICSSCRKEGRFGRFVPVPLLAICDAGHLQDFPFREWVHGTVSPSCTKEMTISNIGGPLEDVRIRCACGDNRSLFGVLRHDLDALPPRSFLTTNLDSTNLDYFCMGLKPWAGRVQVECGRPLVGAMLTANNVYYADVRSSIFLPMEASPDEASPSQGVLDKLQTPTAQFILRQLKPSTTDAKLETYAELLQDFVDLSEEQIRVGLRYLADRNDVAELVDGGEDYDELEFRNMEYAYLSRETNFESAHLVTNPVTMSESSPLDQLFSRITSVKRMRETRAQVGFSRVRSRSEMSLREKKQLLWRNTGEGTLNSWLPAYLVHGEGIFFEVREEIVEMAKFEKQQEEKIADSWITRSAEKSTAYVLLHTLSHILLSQMAFESGYGAAAMRERLYVRSEADAPMRGFMIYTAQSDSEGSMGGLVRMATEGTLTDLLLRAIERARWCSADPVCREAGLQQSTGAACHACCHLPETSCECFNDLLDRSLVIQVANSLQLTTRTSDTRDGI